jgi:NAD dependent epimerase/dehydratase family enzyme
VPGFILRLFFGEMAKALLLSGQRVFPKRLQESGFEFKYPTAETALRAILASH